jgi:hypothetical protein
VLVTDGNAMLVPRAGMTTVIVDESLFVYDEEARRFFVLNASAAAIYERCDGASTVDDIATELSGQHPERGEQVAADVRNAVSGLLELGLVAER